MDMGLWMWDGATCCWAIVATRIYVYAPWVGLRADFSHI